MAELTALLEMSADRHTHLCPRQVIGVRMGLAGAAHLGIEAPVSSKRMLVIIETDGCFADGIEVSSGCTMGHRTLRVEDYGKVAATFIDLRSEQAARLAPRPGIRQRAFTYTPGETRRYFAQLQGYQMMPVEELFEIQPVSLRVPLAEIMSRPGVRVDCAICGEEIINQRELRSHGIVLCRACAGDAYYIHPEVNQGIPMPVFKFEELSEMW
jgi:formylmethanofuran dehydrogenase subunit E